MKRLGAQGKDVLSVQSNLAITYHQLGRLEETNRMLGDVYSGDCRLLGEGDEERIASAHNYANSLCELRRFEEAKTLLRKTLPVARRVLGESHELTLRMRRVYARALFLDPAATLDDLQNSITTFEEILRITRRVLGGAHPVTTGIEEDLQETRVALRAHESPQSASGGA